MVLKNLSTDSSRIRTLLSRFGTLIEAVFIFILLFSGIGVVFIGKASGVVGGGLLLLTIGLVAQIVALILLGFYFYFRFLRRSITAE